MATPPNVNAVRVRLDYLQSDGYLGGSRFFLAYAGSTPTAGNLNTLATDVASAWNSNLAQLVNADWTLDEVDCLDLSSDLGFSGYASPTDAGTLSGTALPAEVATGIEYNIGRRYRGGKPRMYLPGTVSEKMGTLGKWDSAWITAVNTDVAAFFAALEALSIGSMGALTHVNCSFYQGVDKNQPPTGTWRGPGYKYPPKYRTTVQVDTVTGYACKAEISSQRRRRTATTP